MPESQESSTVPDHLKLVPNRPSVLDMQLHALSLQVAALYRELHIGNYPERVDCKNDLLEAYRHIRRGIAFENDSFRWGSHSAYQAMQGMIE